MKRTYCLMSTLFVFILLTVGTVAAQSTRDNPIPLNSNEISGSLNNHNEENFYSFVAGPGELTVTLDVKAKNDEQGEMNFELLAKNAATSILCCEYAQGDGGGTGRDVKSVRIIKRRN